VLPFIVGPEQLAFQKDKYIGEATALAQLVAKHCDHLGEAGLLLLHDGELAYDLVQWGWLQECLTAMGFPECFRNLIGRHTRHATRMRGLTGTRVTNANEPGNPSHITGGHAHE
jgi:hypothetical protein